MKKYLLSQKDVDTLNDHNNVIDNLTAGRTLGNRTRKQNKRRSGKYTGSFAVNKFVTDANDQAVSIKSGKMVMGSQVITIGDDNEFIIDASSDGTFYVLISAYSELLGVGNEITTNIEQSSSYPQTEKIDQDGNTRWTYKFALAELTISDSKISNVNQIQYGNHHVAGVLS